jgi:hypothetical protein
LRACFAARLPALRAVEATVVYLNRLTERLEATGRGSGVRIHQSADMPPDWPSAEKGHVWTAPAVQEESDRSAKRSGAAMYPAFECSRLAAGPDVIR